MRPSQPDFNTGVAALHKCSAIGESPADTHLTCVNEIANRPFRVISMRPSHQVANRSGDRRGIPARTEWRAWLRWAARLVKSSRPSEPIPECITRLRFRSISHRDPTENCTDYLSRGRWSRSACSATDLL
jgi:hypothetical protein